MQDEKSAAIVKAALIVAAIVVFIQPARSPYIVMLWIGVGFLYGLSQAEHAQRAHIEAFAETIPGKWGKNPGLPKGYTSSIVSASLFGPIVLLIGIVIYACYCVYRCIRAAVRRTRKPS